MDLEKKRALNIDLIKSLKNTIKHKIKKLPPDDAFQIASCSLSSVIAQFVYSAINKDNPEECKKLLNMMFNHSSQILDLYLNKDQDKKNAH